MRTIKSWILVLLISGTLGCGSDGADRNRDGDAEAIPAGQLEPEQQMRATLESLTEAQARYHAQHGQYAAGTADLLEDHGFTPVRQWSR